VTLKHLAAIILIAMVCGCAAPKINPEPEPVYYVSTQPALAECNSKHPQPVDRENCYLTTAIKAKNAVLCGEISLENLRNLCYHNVGINVRDTTICFKIQNDDWRFKDCVIQTQSNTP
jgi:hypothetical protein